MRDEGGRRAGNVHVIFEQHRRIHDIEQLRVRAIFAEKNVQRESRLRLAEFFARDEGVGRRRGRQFQDGRQPRAAAKTAGLAAMAQFFGRRVVQKEISPPCALAFWSAAAMTPLLTGYGRMLASAAIMKIERKLLPLPAGEGRGLSRHSAAKADEGEPFE
jgi:hypothetical protein